MISNTVGAMSSLMVRLVRGNIERGKVSGVNGAVMLAMAQYADSKGLGINASNTTLGSHLSPPKAARTVSRAKSSLKSSGWIYVERMAMQNGFKNEVWGLSVDRLWACNPLGPLVRQNDVFPSAPFDQKKHPSLVRQNDHALVRQNGVLITTPKKGGPLAVIDQTDDPSTWSPAPARRVPDGPDEIVIPFPSNDPINHYLERQKTGQKKLHVIASAVTAPPEGGGGGENPEPSTKNQRRDNAMKRTS